MSYTEGFAHATFQVAETQEETETILNAALEEAAAMVKRGVADGNSDIDEVNDIIDYDEEMAEDEDEVDYQLRRVVSVIDDYDIANKAYYSTIQTKHVWDPAGCEENIEAYYNLMNLVMASKMITPYSQGFCGCYDSKAGISGNDFFMKRDGSVVLANELAQQLLM